LDASSSRSKPRQRRLRQMINNFRLYWLCSISSERADACIYRPDDNNKQCSQSMRPKPRRFMAMV
jgi:hypothetical protein